MPIANLVIVTRPLMVALEFAGEPLTMDDER